MAQSSNHYGLVYITGTWSDETKGQTNEKFVGDESASISFTHKSNEADGDSEPDVEQEETPLSQQPLKYQTLHCCIC